MASSSSLTPQQHAAVHAREVSVVLSSGAGCGKTHVLTERYLSHLRDDGAEVGQIVAITFTDRAAREMRNRIRAAITHEVKTASEEEAERWVRHLRGLESAQICTIHAFCGTLLRQHALEIGLDPRFEVLEDVLAANLEQEALTRCLQQLLTAQSQPQEDLRELVLLYGWRPVVEAVQGLVRARDLPAWTAWLEQPPHAIAVQWLHQARHNLFPGYIQYLSAANPKIRRCLELLRQTPPRPGTKMAANVRLLLDGMAQLAQVEDLEAAIDQLAEAAKVGPEKGKAWPSDDAYQLIKDAFEGFRKEIRNVPLNLFTEAPAKLAEAAVVGQRFLRVALQATESYRELKHRSARVDFQDLLILSRDLLRDRPEVRERLRQRYRFLLIDELQDTDPVQMELIEHLCGDGMTEGMLFSVGDHSQSIYRFRGADVHLFRALRERMARAGRLGLTRNFRSQPAILDFANALLGHRLQDYEPLEAHLPQVNPGPCVEFLWTTQGNKESVPEARKREAESIARRIAAMVRGERLVSERGAGPACRPVRPGDVVLLFRSMTNVQLYEAALREQGLDYYLVGGRAFFAQQEVYDLLNLLRALENPHDAVSLAGTLRSPFCCLSDEALFVFGRHRDGLWTALHDDACQSRLPADQREAAHRARRFLDRWRGIKDRLPIARLLGEVFADSGYDAATQFEFLSDRKLANLWKLQELARTFDRSGLFGLADFVQRLGDLVSVQPREEQAATQPEEADVVRLMSIHQAKGLEFPVVFIPDLGHKPGGGFPPVARWQPQLGCLTRPPIEEDEPLFSDYGWKLGDLAEKVHSWHEELRTLYVACTRAQDYLVLSAALAEPFEPTNAWTLTLAERFDPRTGACLVPEVERRPLIRVTEMADLYRDASPAPRTRLDPVHGALTEQDADAVRAVPPRFDQAVPQFDAEDGSDRHDWADLSPLS